MNHAPIPAGTPAAHDETGRAAENMSLSQRSPVASVSPSVVKRSGRSPRRSGGGSVAGGCSVVDRTSKIISRTIPHNRIVYSETPHRIAFLYTSWKGENKHGRSPLARVQFFS